MELWSLEVWDQAKIPGARRVSTAQKSVKGGHTVLSSVWGIAWGGSAGIKTEGIAELEAAGGLSGGLTKDN